MHINIVPYGLVAADHYEIKNLQSTTHPTSRSRRFNTARHARLEILPVVPESATFTHEEPPWTPYGYILWHPVTASSQNITTSHIVAIPTFLYDDMMRCYAAWISTNSIPPQLIADTIDTWQSTQRGKQLTPILNGENKWFIRLDQMSPKDSPFGGQEPSRTFEDVVLKLCSSMRAWGCLQRERKDAEQQDREMKIQLVLNPWDENMDPKHEFRVFVPPPAVRGASVEFENLKITAISQYHWPVPFEQIPGFSLEQTASFVCAGAQEVLESAKKFVVEDLSKEMGTLLLKYGFSFDVALQKDGKVHLVEINPFDALSACGACLFNWVTDGTLLYGLKEDVEFRITLQQSGQESAVGDQ